MADSNITGTAGPALFRASQGSAAHFFTDGSLVVLPLTSGGSPTALAWSAVTPPALVSDGAGGLYWTSAGTMEDSGAVSWSSAR